MFSRYITDIIPGRIGKYDSELNNSRFSDHNNLDLTIKLKVYLHPVNEGKKVIGDADDEQFRIDNWPAGEWNKFKTIYQTSGQHFWDNRFWLRTPGEYNEFQQEMFGGRHHSMEIARMDFSKRCYASSSYLRSQFEENRFLKKPNLNCRFRLELVNNISDAHKSIEVYYISHRLEKGSWVPIRPGQNPDFRSSASTYDSGDLMENRRKFGTETITRFTYIHEIGHALGLEHAGIVRNEKKCINVIKKKGIGVGGNDSLCYGTTHESFSDVLGWGKELTWYDALPWRVAAQRHTDINMHRWQIHQSPIAGLVIDF